jgi:hypothetical protein
VEDEPYDQDSNDELWQELDSPNLPPAPKEGEQARTKKMEPEEFFGTGGESVQSLAYLAAAAVIQLGGELVIGKSEFKKHLLMAFDLEFFKATGDFKLTAWEVE